MCEREENEEEKEEGEEEEQQQQQQRQQLLHLLQAANTNYRLLAEVLLLNDSMIAAIRGHCIITLDHHHLFYIIIHYPYSVPPLYHLFILIAAWCLRQETSSAKAAKVDRVPPLPLRPLPPMAILKAIVSVRVRGPWLNLRNLLEKSQRQHQT